jgi:pyruvate dehydrogenase (quinone)
MWSSIMPRSSIHLLMCCPFADVLPVRRHKFAELIGLQGIYVDDPDRIGAAWEQALAADRPTVIEFKTDPEVPPLPPHITLKQAKAFATSLVKGDPHEHGVIIGTARQVLASVFPAQAEK